MAKEANILQNDVASSANNVGNGKENTKKYRDNKELAKTNEEVDLGDIEKPVIKETVITIDTTDKRTRHGPLVQPNSYAAKKTVAQGMMDIALITANANQLRYLIEYQRQSPTFYVNVVLIVISLLLQIAVGVSLIFKGRFDMKGESKFAHARRINNYMVVGVFLVTIINVFVAAFSMGSPTPVTASVPVANS